MTKTMITRKMMTKTIKTKTRKQTHLRQRFFNISSMFRLFFLNLSFDFVAILNWLVLISLRSSVTKIAQWITRTNLRLRCQNVVAWTTFSWVNICMITFERKMNNCFFSKRINEVNVIWFYVFFFCFTFWNRELDWVHSCFFWLFIRCISEISFFI